MIKNTAFNDSKEQKNLIVSHDFIQYGDLMTKIMDNEAFEATLSDESCLTC